MRHLILLFFLFAVPSHADVRVSLHEPHWALPLQLDFDDTVPDQQMDAIVPLVENLIQKIEALPMRDDFLFRWATDRGVLKNKALRLLFTHTGSDEYKYFFGEETDQASDTRGWTEDGILQAVTLVALDHYWEGEVTPEFQIALMDILVRSIYGQFQAVLEFDPQLQNVNYDENAVNSLLTTFKQKLFFSPLSHDLDPETQQILFAQPGSRCSGLLQ